MSQQIHCRSCKIDTATPSMASLIARHTDPHGRLCCATCGGTDTFLQSAQAPGNGTRHETWIKGIIPIDTKFADAACVPFVFLVADAEGGDVTGIAFKYYRNAPSNGGRAKAKRSHGGPVLAQSQLLSLVARLVSAGVVSNRDWRDLLRTSNQRPA